MHARRHTHKAYCLSCHRACALVALLSYMRWGSLNQLKKKVISSADLVSREGPPSCFENQLWIICLGVVEKRIDHRNGDDLPPVHMYTHTYTRVRAHTHTRKCVSPLTPLPTDNYIGFFTWARTSISDFSERWKKKQKTIRMPKRR